MKNKKTLPILLALFVLLLGGAYVLYERLGQEVAAPQLATQSTDSVKETEEAEEETQSEMPKAMDFTVYDLDGNEVHLFDYIGKPIVLNFWASWCGPCQMEMPDFHEKYLEQGEEIHFLMVNMTDGGRETVDTASKFIEEKGYTFPVFYDKDSNAATTYRTYSLPTTYFIDSDGYAVAQATGAIDAETLQKGIAMIIEES